MNEMDLVDVSKINLYYSLKKNIPFDEDKDTIVTYLEELKEFDKKYVSGPIKIVKNYGYIFILVAFSGFSLLFFSEALTQILKVFQNTYFVAENHFFLDLGIPKLFIPPVIISMYLLAGSLMLLAAIFFLISKILGVNKNWTNYHVQLLILTKKLQETDRLEDHFGYQKNSNAVYLKKMSINWEMEWIFPFVFRSFPPYFQEMGEIFIYFISLLSFPLPVLLAIFTKNLLLLTIFLGLVLFLSIMTYFSSRRLIQEYRNFKKVQQVLIERQQEKLLQLLFQETVDPLLVHTNQENMSRLANERSIPTSLPLYFLTILLPIFSAIIGYVILALENV